MRPTTIGAILGVPGLVVSGGGWRPEYAVEIARRELVGLSIRLGDEDSLDFLADVPALTTLVVNAGPNLRDLSALAAAPRLRSLTLNVPSRPKLAFDLRQLEGLEALGLYWNDGLQSVFDCASLTDLFMFNPPDADLQRFSKLTSLKRLELSQGRKLRTTAGVEALTALRFLGLYGQSSLQTLDGVERLLGLESLELEQCRRIASIEQVAHLAELTTLKLADCGPIESLRPVRALSRLAEFFAWGDTRIMDDDLRALSSLPALRTVAMRPRESYSPSVADIEAALDPSGSTETHNPVRFEQ